MDKNRFKLSLTGRKAMHGRMFILPWLIGFIAFFAIPLVQSLFYTFNKISIEADGLVFTWVGIDNYMTAFASDAVFTRTIVESVLNILVEVPVIVFFSVFVAIILKDKFMGRSLMRAIFFFPVIISSGVVITILREHVLGDPAAANQAGNLFQTANLKAMLVGAGMDYGLVNGITGVISRVFDLTWKSGVQTLLLLSALHAIPDSMYEAADIEGATAWEKFWKITFVLISPTMLLAVIYSVIDYFTDYGNGVMRLITQNVEQGKLEYSTTLGVTYFVIVMVLIAVVNAILSKRTFYIVE